MFIDQIQITIKAGDGGNGCVSFHREKYISHGGPDGGDGGRGGSIIFVIEEGANTLLSFRYHRKFIAKNGEDGMASKFHGKSAEDLIIPVPAGTLIRDAETGAILKDMSNCGPYVCLQGGRGGWGNRHFATPTRQIPRFAKGGRHGEQRDVILELKMLADVGLVGLPNAGKSSLLSRISAAKPKIADYPFTTLQPSLGVVSTGDGGAGFVAADIPGLIEGAGEGAGLGFAFLRHVERCRLLLHVVDGSDVEGNDPVAAIATINKELATYSPALAERPQLIVINKCDAGLMPGAEEDIRKAAEESGTEVFRISAVTGEGVPALLHAVAARLRALPPLQIYEPDPLPVKAETDDHAVSISHTSEGYEVTGLWLRNLVDNVNFEDRESLNYFDRILRDRGVYDRLRESGIQDGDTVTVYGFEFDFVE